MRLRPRATLLTLTTGLTALAGCDLPGFGIPDSASEEGDKIFSLWQGFFLAAMGVGALVWSLLIFVVLRYRRRNDDVPSQRVYNVPIEVLYTTAPIIAVAVLLGFSWTTEEKITKVDRDADAVKVEVVGFQWSWQFRYKEADVNIVGEPGEPPELVLPVNQPTHLELISNDVNHSFWVPDFLSKRDLIPGVDNEIQVTPTETGEFVGRCAEFCGLDHWAMNFSVRVVSESEFEAWLDSKAEDLRGGREGN